MPMTPLLLLSHGDIAAVLQKGAEAMYGPLPQVTCLALGASETPEDFLLRVQEACAGFDQAPLVIVDLACGTPWNVALRCGLGQQGEVLAGLSLPLLLEALGLRDLPPRELAAEVIKRCANSMLRASVLMAEGRGNCP